MPERADGIHPTAAEMVAEALVENLGPNQMAVELGGDVVLIDIREEDENRTQGWIADSVRAPRGMLEFWADPTSPYHRAEFDPNRRLILYCATGERSSLAAAMLKRMGYRRIAHLKGGLRAWREGGGPVERS